MDTSHLLPAFGLTLLAGLATGAGSTIAFFSKRTNPRLLSVALGFSAGVMIYVSFTEVLREASASLVQAMGSARGTWMSAFSFFLGIGVAALIDRLVPAPANPHAARRSEEMAGSPVDAAHHRDLRLMRMGLLSAIVIAVHNVPEGLAVFISALQNPTLGFVVAFAVAIHNIPEGVAIAVPIYWATGSRKKAFVYSFLSGLAEPAGAIIGYLLLRPFFTDKVFGILFGAVAGIMVFISLDELLPTAREYGEHHLSMYGLVGGMIFMALGLLLMQ